MLHALLRRLTASGFRRGVAGGSRTWLILGILAAGAQALRRLARQEPDVLYRTAIRPGDVFEIITKASSE
ncbi:MAG TPA: hypothetical protein VN636_06305 [Acidimicrobiia bacterium]|nr:hypothetical protein [Acidimicrobiia bacterium]